MEIYKCKISYKGEKNEQRKYYKKYKENLKQRNIVTNWLKIDFVFENALSYDILFLRKMMYTEEEVMANLNTNLNKEEFNRKEINTEKENIEAFRKAYYELLYHYDSSREKQNIKALALRNESIFSKITNRIKSFFFFI